MSDARRPDPEHPFWAAVRGDVPPPPAARLLGWKVLEAEPGSGRIRVQFEATEDFTNPLGHVQGGFIAAMLDDTLGPAGATTAGADEFGPTVELKVNFIRPARPGTFVGTGRVVHRGRSIVFLEGELRDDRGELVATATATARIVRVAPGDFALQPPR
jgi:uncharacterized protein (TIGR00369 family)